MEEKNVIEETVSAETAETKETAETAEAVQETESKEMKELKEKLEQAEAERVATNDKYLRMMAEYDNYRKRSTKEKENARRREQLAAEDAEISGQNRRAKKPRKK